MGTVGLRRAEVGAVRWGDLDGADLMVPGKGGTYRPAAVPPSTRQLLAEWKRELEEAIGRDMKALDHIVPTAVRIPNPRKPTETKGYCYEPARGISARSVSLLLGGLAALSRPTTCAGAITVSFGTWRSSTWGTDRSSCDTHRPRRRSATMTSRKTRFPSFFQRMIRSISEADRLEAEASEPARPRRSSRPRTPQLDEHASDPGLCLGSISRCFHWLASQNVVEIPSE